MALINYGEEYGKLVVISDVVDQNRVTTAFLLQSLGHHINSEAEDCLLVVVAFVSRMQQN